MPERIFPWLAAVCLSVYWFWVPVKLFRLGRKIGKDPNAMPRETVGQLMRVLWYPTIFLLLAGLWLAVFEPRRTGGGSETWRNIAPLVSPLWALDSPSSFFLIIPAFICLLATVLTFVCWRKMGSSWRIGIDPNEKLPLVSTGPYRFVRHPIYSLRMAINICVILMVPTPLVLAAALIDCLLLQIEARREERYMESKHGEVYARYRNSVGRFIPRAFVG